MNHKKSIKKIIKIINNNFKKKTLLNKFLKFINKLKMHIIKKSVFLKK